MAGRTQRFYYTPLFVCVNRAGAREREGTTNNLGEMRNVFAAKAPEMWRNPSFLFPICWFAKRGGICYHSERR
jgi:hypothetical protein